MNGKKYSVLLATMAMEIGGAETHVLELAKALKRMGIKVYVTSNGGVYVDELTKNGIEHFKLPLHNKNLKNMVVSYRGLKKIIREKNISLIHAHARIPAFLCGILYKKMNVHFITSAHWVFTTEFPFNILTNWGERTIAVSEDIKKYLTGNYKIEEKYIATTVNGIDTYKFSPNVGYEAIQHEFKFDKSKKKILYVARLDKSSCTVAAQLINSAEGIYKEYQNFEMIIVGGGTDFKDLKAKAEEINNKLKQRLIIMTGPRTDVNRFYAMADFFVGVSRSALEAMAAERPVVLAGSEGYIGIYDETKKEISIKTNLCFRGCEQSTEEKLRADCVKLLKTDKERLEELGKMSNELVRNYFSVDKMAEDTKRVYDEIMEVPLRRYDAVISGYYGSRNSGDDALLCAIVRSLKKQSPGIKIVVLSRRPRETMKDFEVSSVYWLNVFSIIRVMKNAKLLIMGGGNLMQDSTSRRTIVYYLGIIKAAKRYGAKIMLYANGIGPLNYEKNINAVKYHLNNSVDYITLREEYSYNKLKELNVTETPVEVTADAAFLLPIQDKIPAGLGLNVEKNKYFVVSVRGWKKIDLEFAEKVARLCDYIKSTYGLEAVFVSMQDSYDIKISKQVCDKMKNKGIFLSEKHGIEEMLGIVQNAAMIVGMRLHTIIYAACAGVPSIGLEYEPKVKAMMDYLGVNYYCDVKSVDFDELVKYVDEIMNNYDEISKNLRKTSKEMNQKALRSTDIALQLMSGGSL